MKLINQKSWSLCLLAALALTGCNSKNKSPTVVEPPVVQPPVVAEPPNPKLGIWSSPAYGRIYEISETDNGFQAALYRITQSYCVPATTTVYNSAEELDYVTTLIDDGLAFREPGQEIMPGVMYQSMDELPENCANELVTVKGQEGYEFDARRDFEIFWETFNEIYLDFDLVGVDWQEMYVQAEQFVPSITSETELFILFSQMIAPLQDGHNSIIMGDLRNGVFDLVEREDAEASFSASFKTEFSDLTEAEFLAMHEIDELTEELFEEYLTYQITENEKVLGAIVSHANSEINSAADESFFWFTTAENYGYLHIGAMSSYGVSQFDIAFDRDFAEGVIDQVIEDFAGVKGLIIDVRLNDGGHDDVSMAIASRFLTQATHVLSKQARFGDTRTELVDISLSPAGETQFLGPVALLTGPETVSAAETFTIAMRNLPNVTIIGEATGGILSDILEARVASDIAFGFSNEYYLSPQGEWFERTGVPVDIDAPFATKEQRDHGFDLGFELALDWLRTQ